GDGQIALSLRSGGVDVDSDPIAVPTGSGFVKVRKDFPKNPFLGSIQWQDSHLDRDNLNTQATEQGKQELLHALKQMLPDFTPTTLLSHQAHIRPCTLDKQPFIGLHPEHSQLAIFNGFGAKGSLQIPWYSRQFADALLHSTPLPSSCTIQRHYHLFFSGNKPYA
ncbi:MAG: FAD-dependent oxidoreductase, partial [Methylobacter sp.]